jgi:superfamily II DNA or RNA helicase
MSQVLRTYLASLLTRKHPLHDPEKLNSSIRSANVALNPHQVDAAVYAFNSPLSRGAILADEVGLGKTIEAGLIINQLWVEGRNKILILVPASLRTQWMEELQDRFGLPSILIDSSKLNKLVTESAESGKGHNPFDSGGIFIASHHFGAAEKYKAYTKYTKWDLVVVDEAHRMRNVYRKSNKVAKRLKEHIDGRPKVLLTATPLQNNLMELYGLVSFIDGKVLGTDYSYKTLYQKRSNTNGNLEDLRQRLMGSINAETGETEGGVLTRTLRKQVRDIVRFTDRHCVTENFEPETVEIELYNGISEYLARPYLASTLATQRNMMELVYRKILASSSFAIAGTLEKVAQGLSKMLQQNFAVSLQDLQKASDALRAKISIKRDTEIDSLIIELANPKKKKEGAEQMPLDLDDLEISPDDLQEEERDLLLDEETENVDDLGEDEDLESHVEVEEILKKREVEHTFTKEEVFEEYEYILSYLFLARSIKRNQKGQALINVLAKIFEYNDKQGWPDKAVIFTESRRTQDYLESLLSQQGYGSGIVLFNGTNASKRAKETYIEWCERFPEEAEQNSKSVNLRRALVWKFKQPESKILITTEAGAEGLNLQFANIIINFDLPWNPQRLEQRIGRCHRYGQEHDVLVANFLNKSNYADQRVYELLQEKIRLFGNLFDFSDKILGTEVQTDDGYEVREIALGSLDSGVGFEKKIIDILRQFRSESAMKTEFDRMQKELQEQILEKMENAKTKVIQHFDEEVRNKFKIRNESIADALSRYDRQIKIYACTLMGNALKEVSENRFVIQKDKWGSSGQLEKKDLHATYGIGTVSMDEQNQGVIPLSTRAPVLRPFLQYDRQKNELVGTAMLSPLNDLGKRLFADWKKCEGHIIVHRLHCEYQSVIGEGRREIFEEFVYSGIICKSDGWEIITNQKLLAQLLDPVLMEWNNMKEKSFRIRDDLVDQLPKDIASATQRIIDKNEEFVDRQRALLQQYAQDSLLKIKKEIDEKEEEIKTLERQLKISRTMGAHERRELRDEIDKKQKDYFKVQKKYFDAQEQAFHDRDEELKTLKNKLELTISEEKLLSLHFTIV